MIRFNAFGNAAHVISTNITLNSDLNIVQNSSSPFSISGVISGAYGIQKSGSGELVLSASNTYSGDTYVGSGTLSLSASNLIQSTSDLSLALNASFNTGGFSHSLSELKLLDDAIRCLLLKISTYLYLDFD